MTDDGDNDLTAILRSLRVPEELLHVGEARMYDYALRFAAERLREVALALGRSPSGKALQRVLIGSAGETYQNAAAEVGCDRSNLFRTEQRIRVRLARIQKNGQQDPHL